jgi:hypothetical protein
MHFLLLAMLCFVSFCYNDPNHLITNSEDKFALDLSLPAINAITDKGRVIGFFGCKGVQLKLVKLIHNLNISVFCTTRNLNTFDYSAIPSGVKVYELNLSSDRSFNKFVKDFTKRNNIINVIEL